VGRPNYSLRRALQIILGLAILGVGFSGTLTYREFCGSAAAACRVAGGAGTLLGLPVCVYGLIMYLLIAIVAVAGLWEGRGGSPDR
jgi:ABC-type tungstate transport system substrate-binding protein